MVPRAAGFQWGRAKAREGRHEVDAVCAGLPGHVLGLPGRCDDAQGVPQPLDRRTGNENAAFQGIGRLPGQAIAHGREQPAGRLQHARARIGDDKAPRAAGDLAGAFGKAALPDQRRLLVAGDSRDGDGRAEPARVGDAEFGGAVADLRQHPRRDAEVAEQFLVPALAADVEQHGSRCVGGVGPMRPPPGQAPQQKGVDRSEAEFPRGRPRSQPGFGIEQPGQLRCGKIGVRHESGTGPDVIFQPVRAQALAAVRASAVLPDDRIVHAGARMTVPNQGGLALVRDADRLDVRTGGAGIPDSLPDRPTGSCSRPPRGPVPPSHPAESGRRTPVAPRRECARRPGRQRCPGNSTFPGRWRESGS